MAVRVRILTTSAKSAESVGVSGHLAPSVLGGGDPLLQSLPGKHGGWVTGCCTLGHQAEGVLCSYQQMMEGGTPHNPGSAWSQQEPGLTHSSKRKQGGRFFSAVWIKEDEGSTILISFSKCS